MARRAFSYFDGRGRASPIYDNVRFGAGGVSGGKFVTNDGTTAPVVHGFLTQLDGNVLLLLQGTVIDGSFIWTLP